MSTRFFKGPATVDVPKGIVRVHSDGPCKVYFVDGSEKQPLGQTSDGFLRLVSRCTQPLSVSCGPNTRYGLSIVDNGARDEADPLPCEVNIPDDRPMGFEAMVRQFVAVELSRQAESKNFPSFEEEDDFEIEDEDQFHSPYELVEMQEETPIEKDAPKGSPLPSPDGDPGDSENSDPVDQKEDVE